MAKKSKIYLDYAATTQIDPQVFSVMLPYLKNKFGNSSSLHSLGEESKKILAASRLVLTEIINAKSSEVFFTSSATESNNWALKGVAWANHEKGKHIIISTIEHDCVLNTALWLEKQGFQITKIPVDKYGLINPEDVENAIRSDTILVSIMHANNEIGTIQPIEKISEICQKNNILFHTDAVQTFGKLKIDVKKMNIDLLTASSHKIYGPKGAAMLFIKVGTKIENLLHGGSHEFGLRPSTVNIPSIVGFAQAAEICYRNLEKENKKNINLRDKLISGILKNIPNTKLNGHLTKRLNNNVHISFSGIEGEAILTLLDQAGIACSTGSACSSPKLTVSHVLLALYLPPGQAHGSIRFSLGRFTTADEIDKVLKILPGIVKKLRDISPFK